MNKTISETYSSELKAVLTEFLFGEDGNLIPLDFKDPKVNQYVTERRLSSGRNEVRLFYAEQQLFDKFWPQNADPQVLQIIGGTGTGKSTFIRYFFQYFLPHREYLLSSSHPDLQMAEIHAKAVRRHIVLYADLRRLNSRHLKKYIFRALGECLQHTAERLCLTNMLQDVDKHTEDNVMRNISQLAKEAEKGERKWYISWVLDNADQMDESIERDLVQIVRAYMLQEPSPIFATEPVKDGQRRDLWRVIIPVRPETRINLLPLLEPFSNLTSIDLNPIDPDVLIRKRADFLLETVGSSQRHYSIYPFDSTDARVGFDLRTPDEMAKNLQKVMLAASRLESGMHATTAEARNLLDKLVNDSARRRLNLLPRVALSRSFIERYEEGMRKGWNPPVSSFYFFDGLIRGDDTRYDAAKCRILNLYDLGAKPGHYHSIFVGLHSIYLLTKGIQWVDVKTNLTKIGYPDNDLAECERWLKDRDLIKKLWNGEYRIRVFHRRWALGTFEGASLYRQHGCGLCTILARRLTSNANRPSKIRTTYQSIW